MKKPRSSRAKSVSTMRTPSRSVLRTWVSREPPRVSGVVGESIVPVRSREDGGEDRMLDLTGKVAAVTGAGSGIGQGMAMAFARAGADVACSDVVAGRAEET